MTGFSLGQGFGRQFRSGGGSPAAAPPGVPFYDDFEAPTGSITGRVRGGYSWQAETYSETNYDPLTIATAGKLRGRQGSNPQFAYVSVQTPASNRKWVRTTIADTSVVVDAAWFQRYCADHLTASGPSHYFPYWAPSGSSGGFHLMAHVNNGDGSDWGYSYIHVQAGDVIQRRYGKSGANTIVDLYVNGRKMSNSPNLSAGSAITLTHRFGFRGYLPGADVVEDFEVGDPDSDGMVALYAPARVLQAESDGGLIAYLRGDFSVSAAPGLDYRMLDTSNAVLVGWTAVQSFAVNGLAWSGRTAKLASPPSGGVVIEVRRSDLAGGGIAIGRGSVQKAGEVILLTGQSLCTQMWQTISGITAAQPPTSWRIDSSYETPNDYDRRQLPVDANTANAVGVATLQATLTNDNISLICGGNGGTYTSERVPGTARNDAQRDGIMHGGGNFGSFIVIAGQYDIGSSDRATFVANTQAILDDNMAIAGVAVKGLMVPLTALQGFSDSDCEALRRLMWQMTQDYPARYYWGPMLCDLQHTDAYHHSPAFYGEQWRRIAWSWLKMRGLVTYDRSGPKLVSVVRDSSSQLTVTFDLNGASGLELVNTAYAGDYRGGLRFAAASSFASPLSPTGATINSVSGSTQSVTYTFSGTPFTGSAYVSGPYGSNPFNPSNNATINADMAGKASMLRGLFSSEPSIPVQPYYSGSGDYVSG